MILLQHVAESGRNTQINFYDGTTSRRMPIRQAQRTRQCENWNESGVLLPSRCRFPKRRGWAGPFPKTALRSATRERNPRLGIAPTSPFLERAAVAVSPSPASTTRKRALATPDSFPGKTRPQTLGPLRTYDTSVAARVCLAQTDRPPLPPRAAKEKLSEERHISQLHQRR